MFCSKCGKEIDDEAVVCIHCGIQVQRMGQKSITYNQEDYNQPKIGIGVLLALLLGLIGLLIGILLYPSDTIARKTFIKGWGIAFAISVACLLVFWIVLIFIVLAIL
ncbi:MAG: zinc ribbon domain-containing protein [Clostridia bacterium]|nr:zinc ribbon domain-containing protein [Clostridia bacterium]